MENSFVSFLGEIEKKYRHETEVLDNRGIEKYMIENIDGLQNLKEESEDKLKQALMQMREECRSLSNLKDAMQEFAKELKEKLEQLNKTGMIPDSVKRERIELPEDVNKEIETIIRNTTNKAIELAKIDKSILEVVKLIEKLKSKTARRIKAVYESCEIKPMYGVQSCRASSDCFSCFKNRKDITNDEGQNTAKGRKGKEDCCSLFRKPKEEKEKADCCSLFRKCKIPEKKLPDNSTNNKGDEYNNEKMAEEEKEKGDCCFLFWKCKIPENKLPDNSTNNKGDKDDNEKMAEEEKEKADCCFLFRKCKISEKKLPDNSTNNKGDEDNKEKMTEDETQEINDYKTWPEHVYNSPDVRKEFNHDVVCVIPKRVLSSKKDLDCEVISNKKNFELINFLHIDESDDFVSCLVHVTQKNEETSLIFNPPLKVRIPYNVVDTRGREPIIFGCSPRDNQWNKQDSNLLILNNPLEGVERLAEATIKDEPVDNTFVVVSRLKEEQTQMGKNGGKLTSSVDNRVYFVFPFGCLDEDDIDIRMKMQPMEESLLSNVKEIYPNETKSVISTSHIITFTASSNKKLLKPVSINFTVPLDQMKMNFLNELRIVRQDDKKWKEWKEIQLKNEENKDGVSFDIESLETFKFFVIRCVPNAVGESLNRWAEILGQAPTFRNLKLVIRHHVENRQRIVIVATPSDKIDKTLQLLSEDGFEKGPDPSPGIFVHEREIIHIEFRGNVSPIISKEEIKLEYNSQMRNRIELIIQEIDKYAQRTSDFYYGFAQFFAGDENILKTELLITLPKPARRGSTPLIRAPFDFESDNDSISMEYLKQLALNLGDEWKVLAESLGLSRLRIQAIQDNNVGLPLEDIILDMFITWVKGVPVMINKAQILIEALEKCERFDLAEKLRKRELDYQKKRNERT